MSLVGKIALVTGANSGIGKAACSILSRDGAIIIAVDKRFDDESKKLIKTLNNANHFIIMDVASTESIKNGLQEIKSKYQNVPSIIVNAAGIVMNKKILEISEEEFDDVIQVNLKGTFLIMQYFTKAMVDQNISNGSIINIGSIAGKTGFVYQLNYTASKAGVEAMTKTASKELGKLGIRVNCILPGLIDTPMAAPLPQAARNAILERVDLHRSGKPEEIAEVISFLASDKSSYMTGTSVEVTGGW